MNKRQWGLILIAGALAAVLGMGLSSYKYRTEKASDTAIEELLTTLENQGLIQTVIRLRQYIDLL